jgi:hypothetical protein
LEQAEEVALMIRHAVRGLVPGMVLLAVVAGCSGGSGGSAQPSESQPIPSVAQLQAALLVPTDLPGEWAQESQGTQGGVIELCDAASAQSKEVAAALEFQVGTTVRAVSEPGTTEARYVHQYLLADDVEAVADQFEALQAGAQACYGQPLVPEEDYGTNDPYPLPEVGDERYGEYHVMTSDTPGYGSHLHMAVVRAGPVLMLLDVWEILGQAGAQPVITEQDVGSIVTTAVERFP